MGRKSSSSKCLGICPTKSLITSRFPTPLDECMVFVVVDVVVVGISMTKLTHTHTLSNEKSSEHENIAQREDDHSTSPPQTPNEHWLFSFPPLALQPSKQSHPWQPPIQRCRVGDPRSLYTADSYACFPPRLAIIHRDPVAWSLLPTYYTG